MRSILTRTLLATILLVLLLSSAAAAARDTFVVTQLTTNATADVYPQVSDNRIVWQGAGGSDGGSDLEIFTWTAAGGLVQTANSIYDRRPQVSGNRIVWAGDDGSGGAAIPEVFTWTPAIGVVQLTSDGEPKLFQPQVSGNRIVWASRGGSDGGSDEEIFTWTPTDGYVQITADGMDDFAPSISGDRIVWHHFAVFVSADVLTWTPTGGVVEVYSGSLHYSPVVSGDNVVWTSLGGSDGGTDAEIFAWTPATGVFQLTRNNTEDERPQISGDNVVWTSVGGSDGGSDTEIFGWTPAVGTFQITKNNTDDESPQVSGDRVVWQGRGGSDGGTDYEVFTWTYAGGLVQTVNNTDDEEPQVSGDRIVWQGKGGSDGGSDYEIFTAVLSEPVAPGVVILDAPTGLAATAGDGQLTLTWSAVTGVDGYNLYRDGARVNPALLVTTSHLDAGLSNGATYSYQVTSVLGEEESAPCPAITATPQTAGSPGPTDGPSGFTDVPTSHPYREAIADLAARTIISGFPDGTFRPNNPVIRQQFAKMIVRTMAYPVSDADVCAFTDVPKSLPGGYIDPSDPNYPDHYVAVCAARGITVGKTPTTFAPFDSITRQQLISMVARAATLADPPGEYVPSFSPGQFYPEEHYLNARRADYAGLLAGLQGVGPAYDFSAPASRGECAQLLHNLTALLTS